MRLRVLGPVGAEQQGHPVNLGGPKVRTLLAALLMRHGDPVTTDWLIDVLWGENPPATATKTLQKYVSQLRKKVGDALITHPRGYALELGDNQIDAKRFEILLARAGVSQGEYKAQLIEEALELWRGEPYQDLDDATGIAERTRLSELRLAAVEDLMQARLDLGEHAQIVGRLEALLSEHPLRERLWGQLMVALYRSGRQSDSLRAYRRLRHMLGEELGIEPSNEIQELEDRILRHDMPLSAAKPSQSRTNLRPALTSFVGRGSERREISELLISARLVTLIGPAGSGKTRLATEVAGGRVEDVPDGVWFVDLAPLTSPDQVADAIASPLGVGGQAERPTESVLKDYLQERRLLLIVDNCEHLVAKVGKLTADLLEVSPHLTILATSRGRLGVPGEVVFDVPPLSYPEDAKDIDRYDAVRLFLDRARAADPHFRLTDASAVSVAEICRRLDGIPLAVELAAAQVRSIPPSQLVRHLDERFQILTSPLQTAQPRHRSLQAAVDWSYQLLDDPEQTLFRRLSVFRGGFDFESVRQVCCLDPLDPDQATSLLVELVDRSLVSVDQSSDDHTRYRLLETLREYGRDNLDGAEATALRDAHATYFRDLSEQESSRMRGPAQQEAIRRLSLEHDNLRLALRWTSTRDPEMAVRLAIALAIYWDSVGPRSEGHEWLERAAILSDSLTPDLRIGVRLAACELFSSAHVSYSRRYAEDALAEARRIGDELGEARALRALCMALALGEQPENAAAYGRQALGLFEKLGDSWETGLCLERLAQAEYPSPEQAADHMRRSLDLYREVGDRDRQSGALRKLANLMSQGLGDVKTAAKYAAEAVAICEQVGNSNNLAHAQLEYGKIMRRLGESSRAVKALESAFQQLSKSGDQRCSVRSLSALGTARLDHADDDAAMAAFRASLQRGANVDEGHTSREAIAGLARILASKGRSADAVTLFSFADKLQRDLGIPVSASAQKRREERLSSLRLQIGDGEFERARHAGEVMELGQGVDFALALSMPDESETLR